MLVPNSESSPSSFKQSDSQSHVGYYTQTNFVAESSRIWSAVPACSSMNLLPLC